MSAVLETREPSAWYLEAVPPTLVQQFELLATAAGGVTRLRELILTLAVQGKLVPQYPDEAPASEILARARAEATEQLGERKKSISRAAEPFGPDEELPPLPRGWKWCRGVDLFTVVRGVTYQKADASDSPRDNYLPILRANNIQTTINFDDLVYVPGRLINQEQLLRPGDFVVCLASGSKNLVGKAAAFTGEKLCSFGAFCGAIRLAVPLPFFSAYFASPVYRDAVSEASSGIGINNLKSSALLGLAIALPPEAEQARIVARVDELMQLCDALEAKGRLEAQQHARLLETLLGTLTESTTPEELAANWQRVAEHFDLLLDRPEAVDGLEQTILQLAVRGVLVPQDAVDEPTGELLERGCAEKDRLVARGIINPFKPLAAVSDDDHPYELPGGWKWSRLGSIGITNTGGTPPTSRPECFGGEIAFIGPGQISARGQILTAEKYISELGRQETSIAESGDLLMVCIGGSIGKCAMVQRATAFNQQINSIRFLFGSSTYLLIAMRSLDFQRQVLATATGSATPIISKGKWDTLLVPVPPLAEQARIVDRVTELRRLSADLRQRLAASQATQSRLAGALVESALA